MILKLSGSLLFLMIDFRVQVYLDLKQYIEH